MRTRGLEAAVIWYVHCIADSFGLSWGKRKAARAFAVAACVSAGTEIYGAPLARLAGIMDEMKTRQHAEEGTSRVLCGVAMRS